MSDFLSELRKVGIKPSSHEFKRGDYIYREGEDSTNVWFVEKGLVGLFRLSESGRETFLRVFGVDYVSGHRSAILKESYHATAIALTGSSIFSISRGEFLRLLEEKPRLLMELAQILARDLRQAEERISGMMDKTAPRRVIETILYLQLRFPVQPWTRKEIAEFSETTFETTTRVISQLELNGLIAKDKRRLIIVDPEKLLAFSRTH